MCSSGTPSLTEGMKGSSASGCNVSVVFFSIFYRPGADKHFHMGINIVTGCVVANFLLLVHAAFVCLCLFTLLDVRVYFWTVQIILSTVVWMISLSWLLAVLLKYSLYTDNNYRKPSSLCWHDGLSSSLFLSTFVYQANTAAAHELHSQFQLNAVAVRQKAQVA